MLRSSSLGFSLCRRRAVCLFSSSSGGSSAAPPPRPPVNISSWRKSQLDSVATRIKGGPPLGLSSASSVTSAPLCDLPPPTSSSSSSSSSSLSSSTLLWDNLEHVDPSEQSDFVIQPMWTAMESRVTRRGLPRKLPSDGVPLPAGRTNVKKTEEDHWLEAGVYDEAKKPDDKKR